MDLRQTGGGARRHPAQVVVDLDQADRDRLQHAGELDQRVAGALGLEVVASLGERLPGAVGELGDHGLREPGGRVDAGPDRGAAQRQLAHSGEHRVQPLGRVADRGCVPSELLAEGDRGRVHQVRTSRLHQAGELGGLRLEGGGQHVDRGQQLLADRDGGGDVDRGREGVVGGLGGVDVVVGMYVAPSASDQRSDHLVGVHVGGGAGPGLEDVDRERVVVTALGDRARGRDDRLGLVGREDAEVEVGLGGGSLHMADRMDQRRLDRRARDGEVLHGPLGLGTPQRVLRNPDLSHGVVLDAKAHVVHVWFNL